MKGRRIMEIGYLVAVLVFVLSFLVQVRSTFAQDSKTVGKQDLSASASPEESIIRQAYKKLAVYEVVDKFARAASEGRPAGQALAQKSLKFKLHNFRVGRIEDIRNTRFSNLSTLPSGEIIDITPISTSIDDEEEKFSVKAAWKNASYSSGFDPQWTVGDVLQLDAVRFNDVEKYASYEVTVALDGRKRTYNSMVFFHNSTQSSQNLNPEFFDNIVGMGGILTRILRETKFPLGTKKREASNQSLQVTSEIKETDDNEQSQNLISNCVDGWDPSCSGCLEWYDSPIPGTPFCMTWDYPTPGGGGTGGSGTYCNQTVFYKSFNPDFGDDDVEHTSGNHNTHTLLEHVCGVNIGCATYCKVSDNITNVTDEGELVALTVHATTKDIKINERSGRRNTDVQCETAVAYGVKSCLPILGCNASVSVQIVGTGQTASTSVSGNGLIWNRAYIYGGTCRNGR